MSFEKLNSQSEPGKFFAQSMREIGTQQGYSKCLRCLSRKSKVSTVDIKFKRTELRLFNTRVSSLGKAYNFQSLTEVFRLYFSLEITLWTLKCVANQMSHLRSVFVYFSLLSNKGLFYCFSVCFVIKSFSHKFIFSISLKQRVLRCFKLWIQNV